MEFPEHKIELNLPQLFIAMAEQKHVNLEGGRGLGKSFIVSWRIRQIVEMMPRGKCAIVGRTYEQLLTRTLPSTLNGLTQLGFVKNLHYFVGNKPPAKWNWEQPFEPSLSYDYCITFYNGTTFQLVSLDKTESGRGFNFDAVIGDEAALLDYEKLMNNVLLSRRGNIQHFGHLWIHHSTLFVTTTPVTNKGRWFLKRDEIARKHPNEMLYIIAPSTYNMHNLGKEYFKSMKRELLPRVYNAEVLCIRNGAAERPFYNTFSSTYHAYTASNDQYLFSILDKDGEIMNKNCKFDADVIPNKPIDIALDYNSGINWLVAGQMKERQYDVINSFFVRSPETIRHLTKNFCEYYRYHPHKVVNYYYDHTANYKDASRIFTFADEVTSVLEENGWTVNRIYVGQAPRHETKKLFFEVVFAEKDPFFPVVRINQDNCKYLITSIEGAGAVDGRDGQKKDKSSEKDDNVPPEESTHGSDAFDTLVYWKLKDHTGGTGYIVHAVA
jgi:hypothetical protein